VNHLSLPHQESVADWGEITLEKRFGAQEHFFDFRHLIGHPTLTDNGQPDQEAPRCHF